jgi:hypothetical protein
MRRGATALYLASLAAYATSFALPAFEIVVEGHADSDYGFSAFMLAFFALGHPILGGPQAFLLWLANPAFWAGAILFAGGRHGLALAAGCVAVLLGSRLVFDPLVLAGYYVWLAGMVLLVLACAAREIGERQAVEAEPTAGAERGR